MSSMSDLVTWLSTAVTCVPPLEVQMELTKDTCWNCPSESETTTSQRSLMRS